MITSLVIGCGNIGALYDLDNDKIQTHAKAYYLDPRFSLTVYDLNIDSAKRVANKYNCKILDEINEKTLKEFDCISICGPTHSHLEYIINGIKNKVKLIICEKPIANNEKELEKAKSSYLNSSTKIVVNYMRRFQPSYHILRDTIRLIKKQEALTNISIRYQRGFLNNCSHAFDTIDFLMEEDFEVSVNCKNAIAYDHFENDPTISLQGTWNNSNIDILGLINVKFSFFEIDFYFESHKISLTESGNTIKIFKSNKKTEFLQPVCLLEDYIQENCLNEQMKNVLEYSYKILKTEISEDNFLRSIDMNKRMINYLRN